MIEAVAAVIVAAHGTGRLDRRARFIRREGKRKLPSISPDERHGHPPRHRTYRCRSTHADASQARKWLYGSFASSSKAGSSSVSSDILSGSSNSSEQRFWISSSFNETCDSDSGMSMTSGLHSGPFCIFCQRKLTALLSQYRDRRRAKM